MKKYFVIFVFFLFVFAASSHASYTEDIEDSSLNFLDQLNIILASKTDFKGEHVMLLQSDIIINKDGAVDVIERTVYDFGQEKKRGLVRELPLFRQNEKRQQLALVIDVLEVFDKEGNAYKYKKTKDQKFGKLRLEIGDRKKEIKAIQTYVIKYRVYDALDYFKSFDQLDWEIKGSWRVPIAKSYARVKLGEGLVDLDKLRVRCLLQDCLVHSIDDAWYAVSKRPLKVEESFLVETKLPKNVVTEVRYPKPYRPLDKVWYGWLYLKLKETFFGQKPIGSGSL